MSTSPPYPLKCRTCREKAVVPTTIDYEAEIEHDGRLYQVKVPQLEVLRCSACRAIVCRRCPAGGTLPSWYARDAQSERPEQRGHAGRAPCRQAPHAQPDPGLLAGRVAGERVRAAEQRKRRRRVGRPAVAQLDLA